MNAPKFEDFDMLAYLRLLATQLGYIPGMDEARIAMAKHIHATYPAAEIPSIIPRIQ